MTEETTAILHEIAELRDNMNQRFEKVDERFEAFDKHFDAIDERFETTDGRFETIEGRLDNLEMLAKGNRLILENDVCRAINIIAEGHLDLTRKLDEALRINQEKEMMKLRIHGLECDMKRVKEKVGIQ